MAKLLGIYKCNLCGNIVEVLKAGQGDLVCCGQEMEFLEEKTADSSTEKHVPFIEEIEDGYVVRVGENTAHPMTEEHYITMIELVVDGKVYRKNLTPNDKPEAKFIVEKSNEVLYAREYCNLHGLWKGLK
ncbi:superoxide reductase [Hypnocyclicus thermotrophus]|uniref:Desulfoferrodoxin n=1 Tax=Hypnocyclicus thermotrophus TaxID=1627895 RepID=A0AA46DYW0_9FUSO|nr:desulfoferrodoxin [Hypnocyclicus thermotrophus]TDT70623.1 superoxide reductase [Hypnocyclicus thermotrophus]